MAHPQLGETLASFSARMHRTKNRLLAIPAEVQRAIGLVRRPDNDIVLFSLRKTGAGRWNHHYAKLTSDNEFAIPADVTGVGPGDLVDIKIHAIYPATPRRIQSASRSAAALLLELASFDRPGVRSDGSLNVDDILKDELDGDGVR